MHDSELSLLVGKVTHEHLAFNNSLFLVYYAVKVHFRRAFSGYRALSAANVTHRVPTSWSDQVGMC